MTLKHPCPIDVPVFDGDPWDPAVLVDPYPTYRELRDLGPVVWLSAHGLFALPRFDEVRTALSDWESFSSAEGVAVDQATNDALPRSILSSDPPEHSDHRRPFTEQLSVAALGEDEPGIRAAAERYVERVVSSPGFDGVSDVAKPFSLEVVCDVVGIPDHCRQQLPELAESAFNVLGPACERHTAGQAALGELGQRAEALVSNGELVPGSRGVQLVEETGIQEALRMHAPVHYFTRTVTAPTEVADITLPAGSRVAIMYGSANRDERHYPDPDVFDVTRNPRDQLAFGRGVHLCVGIHLAKLEGHSLLEALAARVEGFEFEGEPEWIENSNLHGLSKLPLRATSL